MTLGNDLSTLRQAARLRIPTFTLSSFLQCCGSLTAPPTLPAASRYPTLSIQSASGRHAPFHRAFAPLPSGLPSHPQLWLTAPKGGCPFVRPRARGAVSRQEREREQAAQAAPSSQRSVQEELLRDAEAERLSRHMCEVCGETFAGRLLEHLDSQQHADRQKKQDWTQLADIRDRLRLKRRQFDERWQQTQQQQQEGTEQPQAARPPRKESRSASGLCLTYSRHAPPAEWELPLYADDVVWSSPSHLHGQLVHEDDPLWQIGVRTVHDLYLSGRHKQLLYPAAESEAEAAAAAEATDAMTDGEGAEQCEDVAETSYQSCEELSDWPSSPPPAASAASLPSAPAAQHSGCSRDVRVLSEVSGGAADGCSQPLLPSPALQPVACSSGTELGEGESEPTPRNERHSRDANGGGCHPQLLLSGSRRNSAADGSSLLQHEDETGALPEPDAAVAGTHVASSSASDGSCAGRSPDARKRRRSAEMQLAEQQDGAAAGVAADEATQSAAVRFPSPAVAVEVLPVALTPTPLPPSPSPNVAAEAAFDGGVAQPAAALTRAEQRHRQRLKQWSRLEASLGAGEATRCSRAGEREGSRAQPQQSEELLRDAQQFMRRQDARQRDTAATAAAAASLSGREERQRARRKREESQSAAATAEQQGGEARAPTDRVPFLPVLTRRERRWLGLEIYAM